MPLDPDRFGEQLVKNRTIRGTRHAYAEADLSLFLHAGRYHILGQWNQRQKTNL